MVANCPEVTGSATNGDHLLRQPGGKLWHRDQRVGIVKTVGRYWIEIVALPRECQRHVAWRPQAASQTSRNRDSQFLTGPSWTRFASRWAFPFWAPGMSKRCAPSTAQRCMVSRVTSG